MWRLVAGLLLATSAVGCSAASHAGERRSVIPTPAVFEDDEGLDRIAVRAIWIVYAGAKGAATTIERTRNQAHDRAEMVAGVAQMSGESFPELVQKYSDRPSLKDGGGAGAVLERGNGLLPPPAEEAAFRLAVGEVSPVVMTEEGFVIIMRTIAPRPVTKEGR